MHLFAMSHCCLNHISLNPSRNALLNVGRLTLSLTVILPLAQSHSDEGLRQTWTLHSTNLNVVEVLCQHWIFIKLDLRLQIPLRSKLLFICWDQWPGLSVKEHCVICFKKFYLCLRCAWLWYQNIDARPISPGVISTHRNLLKCILYYISKQWCQITPSSVQVSGCEAQVFKLTTIRNSSCLHATQKSWCKQLSMRKHLISIILECIVSVNDVSPWPCKNQ